MIEITIDQYTHVELPKNRIQGEGFQEVMNLLKDKGLGKHAEAVYKLTSIYPSWRQFIIAGKGEYVGTWPKRFSKYMYQEYAVKTPHEILAKIGEILANYCERGNNHFHFMFSKFVDWQPGDFGEPGGKSCWWSDAPKANTRKGLGKHPNGYSVLFYRGEASALNNSHEGIGRCWAMNTENGLIIFNAYGEYSLQRIAQVLSTKLGLSYKKVIVRSHPKHEVYINRGNRNNERGELDEEDHGGGKWGIGYLIAEDESLRNLDTVSLPDFRLRDGTCARCAQPLVESDSAHNRGRFWCDECKYSLVECKFCGNLEEPDTMLEVYYAGHKVKICSNHPVHECTIHGLTLNEVTNVWHTSRYYCNECVKDGKLAKCDGCGRFHEQFTVIKLPLQSLKLCKPCVEKAVQHAR